MYHRRLASILLIVSVVLSLSNGATFYPKSLETQQGSASSTSLSALQSKDQSGSQDTWNKYVEFYGSNKAYKGVFTFDVSSASSVSAYTLDVNFKGPKTQDQVWQFEFYVPSSNTWVLAGDNTDAASWSWTALSFCGQDSFSSIVKDGSVKVRLSSTTKGDDCDIDYLAISTTSEGSSATSAPTTKPTSAPATSAPTTKPTSAPTTRPATAAPTPKATAAPTPKATAAPTPKATAAPTPKATAAPTPKATAAPTTKPTSAPATSAPTTKPTSAPATSAPTTKPTSAPSTSAPSTAAPGGRICPAGQVWSPAPGTTWQWQLTGTIDQSLDVQMYDIDLFDNAASVITSLHNKGRVVICYFSTQYEDWRSDASKFTSDILGNNLDDWPGERYVDIRSTKLRTIMTERLDMAVTKGCDGVEPDNVDSYANSNGLGLTAADQIDFNKFIATESHKRGLSVGLKNDLDQVSSLVSSFDWALNEQCNEYGECSTLNPFVTAGKAVFGVEYEGSASTVCQKMVNAKFSWLMKDLDLDASGTQCCTYATGGCATKASYKCVSYSSKRDINDNEVIDELVAEPTLVEAEAVVEDHSSAASSTTFTLLPAALLVAAVALVM